MFTGIIEEIGSIISVRKGGKFSFLTIQGKKIREDLAIGDSVAVNGVCLTATSLFADGFTADVMNESLIRTSLGLLRAGSKVNLERAMPMNGRFGGHIVSGHIDGTGTIAAIQKESTAIWYTIQTSKQIMKYIIEKGSITIDGISLTVAYVDTDSFRVSIIPHTSTFTTLSSKKAGDIVNLENDIIGKYIEKFITNTSTDLDFNITQAKKSLQNGTNEMRNHLQMGEVNNLTGSNTGAITNEFLIKSGF